jgi:hypothetical protein
MTPFNDPGGERRLPRRTFLRETALGALALSLSRWLPSTALAIAPERIPTLKFLTQEEYLLLSAVAARMVGGKPARPGASVDAALRADEYLASEDPEIREQFHLLLTLFGSSFAAFVFDFRLRGFVKMDGQAQDSYLEDWMTSWLAFRRTGFQALKRLCMSMYYSDTRSWPEISYHPTYAAEAGK